jgi:hypothetical protein
VNVENVDAGGYKKIENVLERKKVNIEKIFKKCSTEARKK